MNRTQDRKKLINLLAINNSGVVLKFAEVLVSETFDKGKNEITTANFRSACDDAKIKRIQDANRKTSDGTDAIWWLWKWAKKEILTWISRGQYEFNIDLLTSESIKIPPKSSKNAPTKKKIFGVTSQKFEASLKNMLVNKYERKKVNRDSCLKHHGAACKVCKLSFGEFYGKDIAEGFIHVHHLVPLSKIHKQYEAKGKEYKPNPETQMIPVCPNCHAMLHYGFPEPETFEEAKEHVEELKKRIENKQR